MDQIQTLVNFGLTATQAKVYLYLNNLGQTTAKSISNCSKVKRQDIYRVLEELFEFGLIEKILARPCEFRAIPPTEGLKLLVRRRNKETKEFQKTSTIILANWKSINNEIKNGSQTVLVPPKESILLKAEEMISTVRETLSVLSPPQKLFPWIIDHHQFFLKALARNVKIRFITMKTDGEAFPKLLRSNSKSFLIETRQVSRLPALSFGIYDRRALFLEMAAEGGYLNSQALISNNPCLVELASGYFESVWGQAEKQQSEQKLTT